MRMDVRGCATTLLTIVAIVVAQPGTQYSVVNRTLGHNRPLCVLPHAIVAQVVEGNDEANWYTCVRLQCLAFSSQLASKEGQALCLSPNCRVVRNGEETIKAMLHAGLTLKARHITLIDMDLINCSLLNAGACQRQVAARAH